MCLYQKEFKEEISEKPVKCYKFYAKLSPGLMSSPFMGETYFFEPGRTIRPRQAGMIQRVRVNASFGLGFIHAYTNLRSLCYNIFASIGINAVRFTEITDHDSLWEIWQERVAAYSYICEMEIPAGEAYYEGEHDDICSRAMVLNKEIKLEKETIQALFEDYEAWWLREIGY